MKVDIEYRNRITIIRFSNKNVTEIEELRFIITAVCYAYSFVPACICNDEWGFETWFNSINPNGAYKKYKIVCGHNGQDCICEWF